MDSRRGETPSPAISDRSLGSHASSSIDMDLLGKDYNVERSSFFDVSGKDYLAAYFLAKTPRLETFKQELLEEVFLIQERKLGEALRGIDIRMVEMEARINENARIAAMGIENGIVSRIAAIFDPSRHSAWGLSRTTIGLPHG